MSNFYTAVALLSICASANAATYRPLRGEVVRSPHVEAIHVGKTGHREAGQSWVQIYENADQSGGKHAYIPRGALAPRRVLPRDRIDDFFKDPPREVPRTTLVSQTFIPVHAPTDLIRLQDRMSPKSMAELETLLKRAPGKPLLLKIESLEWKNLGEPRQYVERLQFSELSEGSEGEEEIRSHLTTVFRENTLKSPGYSRETLDRLIDADLASLADGGFFFHAMIDPRQGNSKRRAKYSTRLLFQPESRMPVADLGLEMFAGPRSKENMAKLVSSKLDATALEVDSESFESIQSLLGYGRFAKSGDLSSVAFGLNSLSSSLLRVLGVQDESGGVTLDPSLAFIGYAEPLRHRHLVRGLGWRAGENVIGVERSVTYPLIYFLRENLRPHLSIAPAISLPHQ